MLFIHSFIFFILFYLFIFLLSSFLDIPNLKLLGERNVHYFILFWPNAYSSHLGDQLLDQSINLIQRDNNN